MYDNFNKLSNFSKLLRIKFIRIDVKRAGQLICLIYTTHLYTSLFYISIFKGMGEWKTFKSQKKKKKMRTAVSTHASDLYNNDFDVYFNADMYKLE